MQARCGLAKGMLLSRPGGTQQQEGVVTSQRPGRGLLGSMGLPLSGVLSMLSSVSAGDSSSFCSAACHP